MATTPQGELFTIHVEKGDVTGLTWTGDFRSKPVLSFRDQMACDRMRRELLGADAQNADPDVTAQAIILSELSVRLTDAPQWWKDSRGGLELADYNVLQEVYNQTQRIAREHLDAVKKKGEAAQVALREIPRPE